MRHFILFALLLVKLQVLEHAASGLEECYDRLQRMIMDSDAGCFVGQSSLDRLMGYGHSAR
jgi:hypothetical protein